MSADRRSSISPAAKPWRASDWHAWSSSRLYSAFTRCRSRASSDCTAVATDYPPIGRVPYPWNLPPGAQPYQPSRTDANATGDLPLLEAPTIGGNTYAFTAQSIQPQIRANLGLFAPAGAVAPERKAITVVSHPGTIGSSERAAVEALLGAFGPLRYDADAGPVRFVTLAQLATAYGR